MLVRGADQLVSSAVRISVSMGLGTLFIGSTVVALGTSLPEWFVSMVAALQGNAAVSVGNVLGSNLANIGLVLAAGMLLTPIHAARAARMWELPWSLGAALIFWLFVWIGSVPRFAGIGLLLAQVVFVFGGLRLGGKHITAPMETILPDADISVESRGKALLQLLLGLVLLAIGASGFIEGATGLAKMLGVEDWLVGLTVVSLGTSLPELVTTIVAARRGESDLGLGNILGSNVWNTLFILGSAAIVQPMDIHASLMVDSWILTALTLFAFLLAVRANARWQRVGAVILVTAYGGVVARWVQVFTP